MATSEGGGYQGLTYRLNGSNVIPEARFESQMLSYNVLSKLAGFYVSDGIGGGLFNLCENCEMAESSSLETKAGGGFA